MIANKELRYLLSLDVSCSAVAFWRRSCHEKEKQMATIRESDLPGIGRKFQVQTRSGEILVIIVHDTGPRELYHIAANAPDTILSRIELDDSEARQVAGIIGGMTYQPTALEAVEMAFQDMVIEWFKVEPESAAVDKSIAELRVRQQSGATIIAIIGPERTTQINPDPAQVVHAGATLVVVGSREHIQAFKQLMVHGGP
jgi:TrkA domain protein